MQENVINSVNDKKFFDFKIINIFGAGTFASLITELIEDIYPHLLIKNILATDDIHVLKNLNKTELYFLGLGYDQFESRKKIIESLKAEYLAPYLISPAIQKSSYAKIGCGSIILGTGSIAREVNIGTNNILYSGAILESHVETKSNVVVGPGVVICSSVSIGDNVQIGAGAIILPKVQIASGATIGAGALIRSDVNQNEKVVGIPARRLD